MLKKTDFTSAKPFSVRATYTPPKGYFVAQENPEDFAKYEAEFPYKEKLILPGQLG